MKRLSLFFYLFLCIPVLVQAKNIQLVSGESIESTIAQGEYKHYKIPALAGQTITSVLDQLSADADLRMNVGSRALHHRFDCKSINGDTQEDSCSITLDHDADVYISIDGYRAANYRLTVTNGDKLLFSSGFEQGVYLQEVDDEGNMFLEGSDKVGNWPIDILGAEGSGLHVIGNNLNGRLSGKQLIGLGILDAYIDEELGHNGKNTDVLVTRKYKNPPNNNEKNGYTQIPYTIRFNKDNRPKKDLYIRYWIKIGSFDDRSDSFRAIFQYKTPSYDDGSGNNNGLRLTAYVNKDVGDNKYYWQFKADNDPEAYNLDKDNDPATWSIKNKKVPVPIDEWFLTEYYWHWSEGDNGKAAWKVNGQLIAEHNGPTTRDAEPINIIMLSQTYGDQSNLSQSIDDIEIWDGLPSRYKGITELEAGDSLSSFASHGDYVYYKIPAKENSKLTAVLNKLSADADLYMRIGSKPTLQDYDCSSYKGDTRDEKCSINLNQDSDIYILVHGFEAANYQLRVNVSN